MKICFVIPFYYKWGNYSNVRANYEYLQKLGYEVDIFSKKENKQIDFEKYDLVMLHGSGAFLTQEQKNKCKIPIFSFGWSDPNIFNELHFDQGDIYLTNDLTLSKSLKGKPIYFYNTACDKRHHINLNLEKETDILVYGVGQHPFVPRRNEYVNNLRNTGFKVKVFGRKWDKHEDTHEFLEGEKLSQEICKAHILLDVTNDKTAWGHRIFESSARGTPVLTYSREDTKQLLKEGFEVLLYKNIDDIINHLKWAKQHPDILKMIGFNAQQRCYKDHDISVRIQELLKIIKENEL